MLQLLGELDDHGVEDAADLPGLHEVPGEGAQVHADLVRRDAGAAFVVDGVLEVAHEGAGALGDGADRVAGSAQHRIADDADGPDGHACPSSAPRTRWATSRPGTTLRSTVQPAATARPKTFTTVAISSAVSSSSGSCTSSAIVR